MIERNAASFDCGKVLEVKSMQGRSSSECNGRSDEREKQN